MPSLERPASASGTEDPAALALRAHFLELCKEAGAATPAPPLDRLPPPSATAATPPPHARRRALLADLGFAACFLAVAASGLSWSVDHPSQLVRQFSAAGESGDLARLATYVRQQVEAAVAIAQSKETGPTGPAGPEGPGPIGPKELQ